LRREKIDASKVGIEIDHRVNFNSIDFITHNAAGSVVNANFDRGWEQATPCSLGWLEPLPILNLR